MRSAKNAMSSAQFSSTDWKMCFRRSSASLRVVVEVEERALRLDHPELGEMAGGVGVLRAERRPEGVDVGERQGGGLGVELAGDGEVRGLAEEVLRVVDGLPSVVRGGLSRSSVVTRNISPAPSQSLAVMIGVCR